MAFTVTLRANVNDAGGSGGNQALGAFTPAANSYLFVWAFANRSNHTVDRNWTISNTGMSVTWTKLDETTLRNHVTQAQYAASGALWYAVIGASPSSLTITVDASTNNEEYAVIAFDATGYDTGSPFPQASVDNSASISPSSSSASGTLTLGSNPTNGNLVVACFGCSVDSATGGGFATPTGYTSLANQDNYYSQAAVFYRTDTTTAAVTCSDLGQNVGSWGGVVFEMALASAGGVVGSLVGGKLIGGGILQGRLVQ